MLYLDHPIHRLLVLLGVILLCGVLPDACLARAIWSFDAGDSNMVPSPESDFGWVGQNVTPAAGNLSFPVENDLGFGLNAWQLADQSSSLSNPLFTGTLTAGDTNELLSTGWRLSFTTRYVFDFGDDANLGVSLTLGGRAYDALFDLNESGDLRVSLNGDQGGPHTITEGGSGPTAYHDFVIAASPGSQEAAFSFNGAVVATWNGAASSAVDSIAWGNFGADQRGIINYHSLLLETAATPRPGDYNGDGRINGLDFEQWRLAYGEVVASPGASADGNGDGVIDAADYTVWRDNFEQELETLLGDYNGDSVVDAADYSVWRDSLGATGPGLPADGDGDLVVGASDYRIWKASYGATTNPSDAQDSLVVPEPASLLLIFLALGAAQLHLTRCRWSPGFA